MTAESMTPTSAPDWSTLTEEVLCPLCEYNLQGIGEPRCPECGYRFDWADILDPNRRLHPYLFEHHVARRAKWFVKTLIGGLRPGRFWRSLHPVQPVYPRRLMLYWGIVAGIYLACMAVILGLATAHDIGQRLSNHSQYHAQTLRLIDPAAPPAWVIRQYGSHAGLKAWLEQQYPTQLSRRIVWHYLLENLQPRETVLWPIAAMLWPWLTLAALLVFRVSMRRAKIKTGHVLRCVVYSFDPLIWIGLVSAAIMATSAISAAGSGSSYLSVPAALFYIDFALIVHILYRLVQAYRLYLRFDRPILTILAAQIIAFLAILKFVAMFTVDLR